MGNVISFFFSSRRRHTRWPRDWSSDVCSSDLNFLRHGSAQNGAGERGSLIGWQGDVAEDDADPAAIKWAGDEIGRASCRERVWMSVAAGSVPRTIDK